MNLRRISRLLALVMLLPLSSANAAPIYVFPVAGCEVNYARAHHDYAATDILAKAGCKFVAPINGVVDEVNRTDSWSGKTNLGIDRGDSTFQSLVKTVCAITDLTCEQSQQVFSPELL